MNSLETSPFKRPLRIPKRITGEPRKTTPEHILRKQVISIRLNDDDYTKVKALAKKQHASISSYCRDMALRRKLPEIAPDYHRERWMQLGILGAQLLHLKETAVDGMVAPHGLVGLIERTVEEIQALRKLMQ